MLTTDYEYARAARREAVRVALDSYDADPTHVTAQVVEAAVCKLHDLEMENAPDLN